MPDVSDYYSITYTDTSSSSSTSSSAWIGSSNNSYTITIAPSTSEWIEIPAANQWSLDEDFTIDFQIKKEEKAIERRKLDERWIIRSGEEALGVLSVRKGLIVFQGEIERSATFILEDFLWGYIQGRTRPDCHENLNCLELAFGSHDDALVIKITWGTGKIDYEGPLHDSAVSLLECLKKLVANRTDCLNGESLSLEEEFFSRKHHEGEMVRG